MLQSYRVDDQSMEKTTDRDTAQRIYLEAYRYALELCENPEIARQVASRFLASIEPKGQASTTLGLVKA